MRPRLLELTAFGPYADQVLIDFGELGDDGLFLVHGPTGSGKTSILDGMTYALYGGVSGTRRNDRLRSDHADSRTPTSVAFEFCLRGSDYRITRTPAHQRAKKSGAGMTSQKPKATLSLGRDGAWEPIADGVEEVGRQITELMGLDREQFGQVVVLPQGAFAQALHADAKDRRRLLSSLFRTGRFEDYTAALATRAKRAEDESAQGAAHMDRLRVQALHRWSVITGDEQTAGVDVADLAARAALAGEDADTAVEVATAVEAATAQALAQARLDVERRRRLAAARATLAHLEEATDEVTAARGQLDAAERAQPLEPLLAAARDAADAAAIAAAERGLAVAALEQRPPATAVAVEAAAVQALAAVGSDPADCEALEDARDALHAGVVRLQLALSQYEQAQAAALSAAVHTTAAQEHREAAHAHEVEIEQLDLRRGTVLALRDAARAAADRLPALRQEHAGLERAAGAAAQVAALRDRCAHLTNSVIACKQDLNDALQHQRALLELRIDGMAAEIAGQLSDGEPCAVCGSLDHPAPAQLAPDAVSGQALDDAQAQVERAREAVEAHDSDQSAARDALHAALAVAGGHADDLDGVRNELEIAATALCHAETATIQAADLTRELDDIDTAVAAATAAAATKLQAAAAADATAQECAATALRVGAEVEQVAGVAGDPGPSLESAKTAAAAADALCTAVRNEGKLRDDADAARERLGVMLLRCGFDDEVQAQAALLPTEQRSALRRQLGELDGQRLAALEIISQEEDIDGDDGPPLEHLQDAHESAARTLGQAQVRLGAVRSAAADLIRLAGEVDQAQQDHTATGAEAQRLRRLADICSGTGNEHRMSLERYVLAAYFEEIAEAASQRLATMTGGRYTLRHSDARARGGAASGLSITVHDAYTGTEREAGTLSGGETFQASLCLALAVAEVVQRHAGGVHLDTLFIDEGFGALDADSLEQAMAELDALREGGRMVGVISHVPALRERISAGIVVTKTSSGSDVRVETLTQA